MQVDSSGLAWIAGSNGTAAYDPSRNPVHPRLVMRTNRRGSHGPLNDFIHHNSQRLSRRVVAITEEDFGDQCRRAGTLQTWRIPRRGRLRPLDSFGVERDGKARVVCSAHYFDARAGLIAQGFYEQGVRLIDARRPGRLRQVGYYLSRPGLFWGALFAPTDTAGETVYGIDHSRGIDVLAIDRAALKPIRRRGATRPLARPKYGFVMGIFGAPERLRRGRRVSLDLVVERPRRTGAGGGDAVAGTRRRAGAARCDLGSGDAHAPLHARTCARRRDAAAAGARGAGGGAGHADRGRGLRHGTGRPAAARRSRRVQGGGDAPGVGGRRPCGGGKLVARFLLAAV